MRKILAIGGAVIKTAWEELKLAIEDKKVEMLIHNGGSLFHDFQRATDKNLKGHSYPLDDLMEDYECNREASKFVWDWYRNIINAPKGSVTRLCEESQIPVLMFTIPGADFWHLFDKDWKLLGRVMRGNFYFLCKRFADGMPFHFVNMGSAVIHPEIFAKVLAVTKPQNFTADVVDFKEMYRPLTRVAKYGEYYQMTHKEYLEDVI